MDSVPLRFRAWPPSSALWLPSACGIAVTPTNEPCLMSESDARAKSKRRHRHFVISSHEFLLLPRNWVAEHPVSVSRFGLAPRCGGSRLSGMALRWRRMGGILICGRLRLDREHRPDDQFSTAAGRGR